MPFHIYIFLDSGPILTVDSSPSHGTVLIAPDKKTLVWDIGEIFSLIVHIFCTGI